MQMRKSVSRFGAVRIGFNRVLEASSMAGYRKRQAAAIPGGGKRMHFPSEEGRAVRQRWYIKKRVSDTPIFPRGPDPVKLPDIAVQARSSVG